MKSKRILCIGFAALLLTGCSSFGMPDQPPPPSNLTAPCDDLPLVQDGMDMGGLLTYALDVTHLYGQCSAKQEALAKSCSVRGAK